MSYKEEMDALRASESLKKSIACLQAPKKHYGKRIAALAAAIVIVLFAGVVSIPALTKSGASYDQINSIAERAPMEDFDGLYGYTNESGDTAAGAAASQSTTLMTANLPTGRKLIRNAELRVETKTFDSFYDAVLKQVSALSGYVQSTEVSDYADNARYASVVVRVPADKLDTFLQSVSALGTVTWQNTDVKDVTDEYVDVESRIAALETEQTTLLELLKKADSLTDVLEIQGRLTEVRSTLETYKAQKKALDSQIDYSAVTLEIQEVERVTPVEQSSFFGQVKQNLSDNLYAIGQSLRNAALWLLSSLPYIALWLVGIGAVVLIVVLVRRKRRR
ncbi:MAG: DUF4349 domain-containing protein [Acutalibacteraceae bacterium]